ncbi:hypothetical protein [Acidovorax sp. M2(2025)]|uniref:hypothetical protein n=1 Tax=Acidovorax sp. M2(2025) TaxID=3411355 RepID=UPI003BF57C48
MQPVQGRRSPQPLRQRAAQRCGPRSPSGVASSWSIYWLDNATGGLNPATGLLRPPVVGGFRNGVGVFEGDDTCDGRPVRVRFEWSQTHTGAPRWQQAFSADHGATWEVNWVMQFTRPA